VPIHWGVGASRERGKKRSGDLRSFQNKKVHKGGADCSTGCIGKASTRWEGTSALTGKKKRRWGIARQREGRKGANFVTGYVAEMGAGRVTKASLSGTRGEIPVTQIGGLRQISTLTPESRSNTDKSNRIRSQAGRRETRIHRFYFRGKDSF